MRFENQVSIYDTDAILRKFDSQETKIEIVQGKISAIISESELLELQGGSSTMYGKLADVELSVDGLSGQFSTLSTKYDALTGQYTSLDSRLASYKATVDGLSANLTSLSTNLSTNYSTTADMQAYADGVGADAVSTASADATSKANAALSSANSNTASVLQSYSTTSEMNTAIEAKAGQVIMSVSETYATMAYTDEAKNSAIASANANTASELQNYSTTQQMNAAIEAKAREIDLAVSSVYATTAYVDSLAASYRNLVLNSAFMEGLEHWEDYNTSYPPTKKEIVLREGRRYLHLETNSYSMGIKQIRDGDSGDGIYLKPGVTYTLQFLVYRSSDSSGRLTVFYRLGSGSTTNFDIAGITTEPEILRTTFTVPGASGSGLSRYDYLMVGVRAAYSQKCSFYLSDFIICEGDFDDDIAWTAAPEDGVADVGGLIEWRSEAELKITDSAIVSTVTASSNWGALSSQVSQNTSEISSKVSSGRIISEINQSAETVSIKASKINLNGAVTANNYFKIGTDGSMQATYGKIANFQITSTSIYSGSHSSVSSTNAGVYMGNDGFSYNNGSGKGAYMSNNLLKIQANGTWNSASSRTAVGFTVRDDTNHIRSDVLPGYMIIGYDDTQLFVDGYLIVMKDYLEASGQKNRVVHTEHYGTRALVCYETPSPMFGDVGAGQLDEEGQCVVVIDDMFAETIDLSHEYFVFLQKEGMGDIWVSEKKRHFFVVHGTPGLKFSWEMKAYQFDADGQYMDDIRISRANKSDEINYEEEAFGIVNQGDEIDYESEAAEIVNDQYYMAIA